MADREAVDQADIQNRVRAALEAAIQWHEEELEPDMVKATDYYNGEPFGDEEEGRSKVVSRDVHDVTIGQLPSLMRIFFGGEDAVEFRPERPDVVQVAAQATDYVNYVVREENDGFLEYYAAFKDALVRRLGIFKWWHEDFTRVLQSVHDVDDQGLMVLMLDADVEDIEIESVSYDEKGGSETYTVRVTRREADGKSRFQAVPPEEFVFSDDARSLPSAPLVAHVREVAQEELLAMGIPEDVIEEAAQKTLDQYSDDELATARRVDGGESGVADEEVDPSQIPVIFAEVYCLVDGDGDGIAETRLCQCIGPTYEIVNGDGKGEIVDEIPFAVMTPDPEPHTIVGRGNYQDLGEVQRVKSHILRRTLDSLSRAVDPDTVVDDARVNMHDVLHPEISGVVRVTGDVNSAMREMAHQFVGHATLPMLEHYDAVREDVSGYTKASAGLDPEALQSSTRTGVVAHLSASQQRIELIARSFAETGVKPLYKGLLRLAVKHANREKMLRLRGEWVAVDPRHWQATMDVQVNVTIGQGTVEDRMAVLGAALGKQMELMQMGSPLVTWAEVRYTLGKVIQLSGRQDGDLLFRPWGPEQQAKLEEQMKMNPPQPSDPTVMLAEVEREKNQLQAQMDQVKLQQERWKIQLEDERERDKMAQDMALKEREIEAKHAADIRDAELKAQVQAYRANQDADMKVKVAQEQTRRSAGGGGS